MQSQLCNVHSLLLLCIDLLLHCCPCCSCCPCCCCLQLLIDFIQCQEELEAILQAQAQLLEAAEQEPMDPNTNVLAVASGNNW